MERESFEDPHIASMMNKNFICIKVDREERPDLDDIYMAATQTINKGQGGWPMTVFLAPDQNPFFAGTYFPPTDQYGRPGFSTVLMKISELWKNDRDTLIQQGKNLTDHLRQQSSTIPAQSIGNAEIETAVTELSREFDPAYGGFGGAPKFPPATALSLLLRHHHRTGDPLSLKIVRVTLDGMAQGGMYDQIGGGFSRYSTDERWLVPHFEKMLYDNALLTKIYLDAYLVTKEPFYRRIAVEILDYILREMTSPEGGFYSATDADSEGVEGKFFVWTPAEIKTLLEDEASRWFCAYYDITEQGNWEEKNIPNTPRSIEDIAGRFDIPPARLWESLMASRKKIYEARLKRVPPGLDDKILTAWNGLMISALSEGARVLHEPRYLNAAKHAADFLLGRLVQSDGRLLRTYRAGKAHLNAYLEDYAYFCEALIDLYEAGGDFRFLTEAIRLSEKLLSHFSPEDSGGFYNTAKKHEKLLLRRREGYDGAIPNANASAAHALARLSFHSHSDVTRKASIDAIKAYGQIINKHPRAFCKSLIVVDFLLEGPLEIALVGRSGDKAFDELLREVNKHYLPNRILAYQNLSPPEKTVSPSHELLKGKGLVDGKPAVYICRNFTCQKPITDSSTVLRMLESQQKSLHQDRRLTL